MRNAGKAAPVGVALIIALLAPPALAQQAAQAPAAAAPKVQFAWSPKLDTLPPYGSNKPITRLGEVLAAHRGESSWRQNVV
jgi:hypothetical protein